MHLIRRPTDFISGLIFFVVAALALAMGSQYVLGTARNMGPGSYPLLVGSLLGLVSLVLISASASGQLRPFKAIILAVGLSVACCAIFVYGLGQQLPIFGHWLTSFTG